LTLRFLQLLVRGSYHQQMRFLAESTTHFPKLLEFRFSLL
jgi:hypothetical protein